ncbi:hypothetical protein [Opitutus terrae]|uniref:Uncharacterized protein n=1 Tax=Opitutus terrae (strain DSM 11246 / JCM 15787 / PB90-1) TaxID=452637 RepID=B1ZUB4_OPITP|nr:hypothetical protein [Opitutus terrae]ACB76676.1 hypothetical protein Oter_3399 [Opitutus terrae PB90-1]
MTKRELLQRMLPPCMDVGGNDAVVELWIITGLSRGCSRWDGPYWRN